MYASLGSGAVLIEMHVRLGVFVAGTVPELKKNDVGKVLRSDETFFCPVPRKFPLTFRTKPTCPFSCLRN